MRRIFCLLCCLLLSSNIHARAIPEEKRVLIDEFLEMTGADRLTGLLAGKLTHELVSMISQKNGQLDRAVVAIIQKESQTIVYEEFVLNNKLQDIMYDLYDEYFTLQDMKNIVTFYKSPTGQRAMQHMPMISRRSMELTQEHARSLAPKIHARISQRFEEVRNALADSEEDTETSENNMPSKKDEAAPDWAN